MVPRALTGTTHDMSSRVIVFTSRHPPLGCHVNLLQKAKLVVNFFRAMHAPWRLWENNKKEKKQRVDDIFSDILSLSEMKDSEETPSQVNRFQVDGMHNIDIVEWNKKRKLQSDQLDLLRPKHKCWVGSFSTEHASMFDENPVLESMHNHMVRSKIDAAVLDDRSEPESAKDSNSFIEDSDTAMSVNEEAKLEADCANTYQYVKRVSYSEEDTLDDGEYNPSYHYADIQALKNPEEHLLGLASFSGHVYSEYAKDSSEHSVDNEFEDFLFSNGVNPNKYVLSSGRWNVSQEAQSCTRPPTIDQEFEQYFSMLML